MTKDNDYYLKEIQKLDERLSKLEGERRILITLITINVTLTLFNFTILLNLVIKWKKVPK